MGRIGLRSLAALGIAVALFLVGSPAACRSSELGRNTFGRPDAWTDTSPHRSDYLTVNGVRLNYLDWGLTGRPVLV